MSLELNAAYFLTPKHEVAFLYADCTLRQGLEKMRSSGYTAIPVIQRDGTYAGTVREGDFLWYLIQEDGGLRAHSLRELENVGLSSILKPGLFPAERITVPMEVVVERAVQQNFVPMVDDSGKFIGIVTRMTIMKHLTRTQDRPPRKEAPQPAAVQTT
ncbi:MAG: CBS domain-containing protein [Oscillospiraceae bacterium]